MKAGTSIVCWTWFVLVEASRVLIIIGQFVLDGGGGKTQPNHRQRPQSMFLTQAAYQPLLVGRREKLQ